MRAMFGLVSLLVVVGVMMWLFSMSSIPTAREGKKAQDQARQISGRGADGRSVTASFKTEPFMRGNQLQGLDVTDVTPGGAMDDYGLKKGDRIIEINGTKVGDLSNNDPELSKDQVMDAYRGTQPIVVVRDGQQVTLPANPAAGGPLNALNNSVKIPMH